MLLVGLARLASPVASGARVFDIPGAGRGRAACRLIPAYAGGDGGTPTVGDLAAASRGRQAGAATISRRRRAERRARRRLSERPRRTAYVVVESPRDEHGRHRYPCDQQPLLGHSGTARCQRDLPTGVERGASYQRRQHSLEQKGSDTAAARIAGCFWSDRRSPPHTAQRPSDLISGSSARPSICATTPDTDHPACGVLRAHSGPLESSGERRTATHRGIRRCSRLRAASNTRARRSSFAP